MKEEAPEDNEDDMGSSSEMETSLGDSSATESTSDNSDDESEGSTNDSAQSLNGSSNDGDEQVYFGGRFVNDVTSNLNKMVW